jgi:hypothetical protein
MSAARIGTAVLVAFIVFGLYSWITTRNDGFTTLNNQLYEEAEVSEPVTANLSKIVSPGGPNAPNQASHAEGVVMPPETPYDTLAETHESADIPERLRHPERMFSPGLEASDTETAVAAGVASSAAQATSMSYQTFGPEFAQNGATFMNGIMANDATVPLHYSSV